MVAYTSYTLSTMYADFGLSPLDPIADRQENKSDKIDLGFDRELIRARFSAEYERIPDLIGKDLPAEWQQ